MASFEDAFRISNEGLLITLDVHPGSGRNAFPDGYNAWRKSIGIAITAPPVDGRANTAIIDLVSKVMGISKSEIRIVSGHQSSRKVIQIAGMTPLQCKELLATLL